METATKGEEQNHRSRAKRIPGGPVHLSLRSITIIVVIKIVAVRSEMRSRGGYVNTLRLHASSQPLSTIHLLAECTCPLRYCPTCASLTAAGLPILGGLFTTVLAMNQNRLNGTFIIIIFISAKLQGPRRGSSSSAANDMKNT